jgi:hypothetical protein
MMGSMAKEIAIAAAALANKREQQQQQQQQQHGTERSTSKLSTGTFSNESIEIAAGGTQATTSLNREGKKTVQPATHSFQPSRPRGIDDPPGWNSKWTPNSQAWMQQQAHKTENRGISNNNINSSSSQYRRPYTTSVPNDDDSFHVPLSSWVPQLRDKDSFEQTARAGTIPTRWQSAATKNTLDTAVPRKRWTPSKHIEQRPRDNELLLNESYNDYSWAPHLHTQDPHAADGLHPTPPGLRLDSNSLDDCNAAGEKDTKNYDSSYVSVEDHIEVDNDESSTQETSIPAALRSKENNDFETTKVNFDTTNQGTATSHRKNIVSIHKCDNSRSGQQDDVSQESTKQSAASDDNLKRRHPPGDYATFLVDAEDTFQVFDANWNFSPSKGTVCVLFLMVVLALEGVAVGLYFALR